MIKDLVLKLNDAGIRCSFRTIKSFQCPPGDNLVLNVSLFRSSISPIGHLKRRPGESAEAFARRKESRIQAKIRSYIDGLDNLIKNYYCRIFVDENMAPVVLEKVDRHLESSGRKCRIEVIMYKFPDYEVCEEGICTDIGLFGTLVRLLPMFDFEGGNKYNMVSDADNYFSSRIISGLSAAIRKSDFLFLLIDCVACSNSNRFIKPVYHVKKPGGVARVNPDTHVIATHLSSVKLPVSLFTDFLLSDKAAWTKYAGTKNPYQYGIDEYFINSHMLKYIYERTKYKCLGSIYYIYYGGMEYSILEYIKADAEPITPADEAILARIGHLGAASGKLRPPGRAGLIKVYTQLDKKFFNMHNPNYSDIYKFYLVMREYIDTPIIKRILGARHAGIKQNVEFVCTFIECTSCRSKSPGMYWMTINSGKFTYRPALI